MAVTKIVKKSFKNDAGEPVEYERLAIIGTIGGEVHTLELKLETGEMIAAKMLLSSSENLETTSRPARDGETVEVKRKPAQDDLFNLDEG